MRNAVGREIPDAILERYGKTGYAGAYARDQDTYQKAAPAVRGYVPAWPEQAGWLNPGGSGAVWYS